MQKGLFLCNDLIVEVMNRESHKHVFFFTPCNLMHYNPFKRIIVCHSGNIYEKRSHINFVEYNRFIIAKTGGRICCTIIIYGSQQKQLVKQSACCRRKHADMDLLPGASNKEVDLTARLLAEGFSSLGVPVFYDRYPS